MIANTLPPRARMFSPPPLGVVNCNYFALGQECRACADTCEPSEDGIWLDQYEAVCKPCSVIFPEPE